MTDPHVTPSTQCMIQGCQFSASVVGIWKGTIGNGQTVYYCASHATRKGENVGDARHSIDEPLLTKDDFLKELNS